MRWWKSIKWFFSETLVGIVSGVVGGVLLLALPFLSSHVRQWGSSLIDMLCVKKSIPLWVIIVSSVLFVFLLFLVVSRLLAICFKDPINSYNGDVIKGIKWRWDYDGYGNVINLLPYCPTPHCDMQLEYDDFFPNHYYPTPAVRFRCTLCTNEIIIRDMNYDDLKKEVIKLIQRNNRIKESGEITI